MTKRFGAWIGLGVFALSAVSMASVIDTSVAASPLKQLNAQIKTILTPFQNDATQATMVFKKVKTDDTRALNLQLRADFTKTGKTTPLEIHVKNFSYAYGDGTAPATRFNVSVALDLTKLLPQEELNQVIPGLQDMVQDFVSEYAKQYGDAAKVTVTITHEEKDAQGNYTSINADVRFKIDLTQLPAGTNANSVLLTEARVKVAADLSQGLEMNGVAYSNPSYTGFQEDQQGLKEYLDKLLSRDAETMQSLGETFGDLDNMANEIVNHQAQPAPSPAPTN